MNFSRKVFFLFLIIVSSSWVLFAFFIFTSRNNQTLLEHKHLTIETLENTRSSKITEKDDILEDLEIFSLNEKNEITRVNSKDLDINNLVELKIDNNIEELPEEEEELDDDFCNQIDCSNSKYINIDENLLNNVSTYNVSDEIKELFELRNTVFRRKKKINYFFCKRLQRKLASNFGLNREVVIKMPKQDGKYTWYYNWIKDFYRFEDNADTLGSCSVPCRTIDYSDPVTNFDLQIIISSHWRAQGYIRNHNLPGSASEVFLHHENIWPHHDNVKFLDVIKDNQIIINKSPYPDIRVRGVNDNKYHFNLDEFGVFNETTYESEFWAFIKRTKKIKTNSVVANFVSNCLFAPYRTMYQGILMKHINIHNYGRCWNNVGGNDNTWSFLNWQKKMNIVKDYKFVLCFENSLLDGWVTEKLIHALIARFTIPIYFGPLYAQEMLPKKFRKYKMFIHAYDYPNPKDLAEYILYLDKNDTAFSEYFQWRFDGLDFGKINLPSHFEHVFSYNKIYNEFGDNISFMCRLCEYMYHGKRVCRKNLQEGKTVRMD